MASKILNIPSFSPIPNHQVLVSIVKEITGFNREDLLKSYVEYSFLTTVDPISDKTVHEEVVRLLVEYVTGKHDKENQLLLYIWFFFDVVIKSIAQSKDMRHENETDRSELISSEFTENIETLLLFIITQSCNDTNNGLKGIVSVAKFIKQCFSFIDRGLVFNFIDKSIEVLDSFDTQFVSELRLDFLSYVCEHEHFIPLNLPFKTKPVLMTFYINDEYCTDHYLAGLLLREFEAALKSDNIQVRSKSIKMVRNVLAKIDFDDRYTDQEEKERISGLFFPLLTITLRHSSKLHKGREEPPPLIPSVPPTPGTVPPLTPPSDPEPANTDEGTGPPSLLKKSSQGNIKLNPITGAAPGIEAINPLDVTAAPPPVALVSVNTCSFSREETRDLLICFLFVVKHLNDDVLNQWWQDCVDAPVPLSRTYSLSNRLEDQAPVGGAGGGAYNDSNEISAFFDILESCAHVFEYSGRISITKKWSSRSVVLKRLEEMYTTDETLKGKGGGAVGGARKSIAVHRSLLSTRSSQSYSLIHPPTDQASKPSLIHTQSVSTFPIQSKSASLIPGGVSRSSVIPNAGGDDSVDMYITMESCLAHEVGIILLNVLELFGDHFNEQINEEHENILITKKFFSLLNTLFEVNPSSVLQHHLLSTLRAMTSKFKGALFKDSPEYCGAICYQILKCCNSNFTTTRAEAIAVLYLLMKVNFKFFAKKSFTRTGLQTTVALSKIATSTGINTSLLNLRRSLAIIVSYAENDIEVKTTSFPTGVRDLMDRLRTVLSSTALMKEHENDPEKLLDLYYSLAESYAHSPELRSTWLESMAERHIQYENHNEAAQCYLHIASLIIEYLKLTGRSTRGCSILDDVSVNVKRDKKKIDLDDKATLDQRHNEVDLVKILELAFTELEKGELYELMTSIFKILLPFYENDKNYKVNQGVQEYANVFLKDLGPAADRYPQEHIESLKEVYREFISLCDEALQLFAQLASKEQSLLVFEMNRQFFIMKQSLEPILKTRGKLVSTKSVGSLPSQRGRGSSKSHPLVMRTATTFTLPTEHKELTTI
uniref:DOCKER domain-containing protein n=1 Tax=Amphimedon queenslandica TaxID=400682 RepID=A0A1X7U0L2_AMPQE